MTEEVTIASAEHDSTERCAERQTAVGTTSPASAEPEDAKGCADGHGAVDATSHVCYVDGRPCEVVAALALTKPLGAAAKDVLPCSRCRAVERDVGRLGRLGHHERRILLEAPGPDDEMRVIPPPAEGRAADEAHRRAIRTLWRRGLVWAAYDRVRVTRDDPRLDYYADADVYKRVVCLTPLGAAVVEKVRDLLAGKKPIRWAPHRAALVAAVRRSVPELLARLDETLTSQIERLQTIIGLWARAGGKCDRELTDLADLVRAREAVRIARGITENEGEAGA